MPSTTSYDRGDIVLVTLPFSDFTGMKQRPAVVVSAPHPSVDLLLLPLTSQLEHLQPGEFALVDWKGAGLLFPSAVKRGLFTLTERVSIVALVDSPLPIRERSTAPCGSGWGSKGAFQEFT